jgi:hypothetical protein
MLHMAKLVSKSEYAKLAGLSKTRITQYSQAGAPTHDGKIDPDEWGIWLEENRDPNRVAAHNRGKLTGKTLTELKRVNEEIKAEHGTLLLRKAKGELVERATVDRWAEGLGRQHRDLLMTLGARVVPMLVGKSLAEAHAIHDAEMRAALIEIVESLSSAEF